MAEQAEMKLDGAPATAPAAATTPALSAAAPADTKTAPPATDSKPSDSAAQSLLGTKPEDAKPADAKPADKPEAKPAEAKPLELKLPEGFDAKAPVVAKFAEIATAEGLKPEAAQKIFDHFAEQAKPLLAAQKALEQAVADDKAEQESWLKQVNKEFTQAELPSAIKAASNAVMRFGGEDLRKFLDSNGLGNNPLLFKAFVQIGRQLGEDKTSGTAPTTSPAKVDPLDLRYPSMSHLKPH